MALDLSVSMTGPKSDHMGWSSSSESFPQRYDEQTQTPERSYPTESWNLFQLGGNPLCIRTEHRTVGTLWNWAHGVRWQQRNGYRGPGCRLAKALDQECEKFEDLKEANLTLFMLVCGGRREEEEGMKHSSCLFFYTSDCSPFNIRFGLDDIL